jgi:DNA-binding MarR family transcriptional regulator
MHNISVARRKNLTEQTGSLGALLRLPYQRLSRLVYGELAQSGFADIRPAHGAVFQNISPDGSRVTEMAERARMTKQSMGYLVDALTERGYVTLKPDPTDGRANLVCLTARGESFVSAAMALSAQIEADAASDIGAEEMARLRSLLQQLDAVLARRTVNEGTDTAQESAASGMNRNV